ncbi:hypothetical protein [Lichenibacterium dinghuense]|uniref:hypothetical protein n=1 Tax=Lichenibacterium dinghuense TaxID=2895977 RepID=UPI001F349AA3|nr:hypothetical protein [Lichenibacterium sp. 6Y81]
MTPAERKFSESEAGLLRAQCLARVLRHATDGSVDVVDDVLWSGAYFTVCEIETALDAATAP